MLNRVAISLAALAFGVGASGAQATDTPSAKAGVLTCHVASGPAFDFGLSRDLHCTFRSIGGGVEFYTGEVRKFGVDIGYGQDGVIAWTILAPTSRRTIGELEGTYAGATAVGAVGEGGGANVLVGGSGHSIALEPVSIKGETGLNAAAGITAINLRSGETWLPTDTD